MYRHIIYVLVACLVLISCKNNSKNITESNNWQKIYTNAYKIQDYHTAIVALNQLIISDSSNVNYYDSLAHFYLKKVQNFNAGRKMVDKGLALNPNNYQLIEYKSLLLLPEGKFDEATTLLEKAYNLSKKNRYKYMIATAKANQNKVQEAVEMIDALIQDKNSDKEMIETPVSEYTSQNVNLKALCYGFKAKLAFRNNDMAYGIQLIDEALKIQPDYEEALAIKDQIRNSKKK